MSDSDSSEDNERGKFRKELSELTFEQLIALKQKIGAKVFKETVKGRNEERKLEFKRTHKKRPREMSSKIPVDPLRKVVPLVHKEISAPRDPRFEKTSEEFDEKVFYERYSFIKDMQENEKRKLYDKLKSEKNEKRRSQIKFLIQRIENKEREAKRRSLVEKTEDSERLARKQAVKDGKKAHFYKKSDKKLMDLVDNYELLKKRGKLKKHIERKIKSANAKDYKRNSFRKNL